MERKNTAARIRANAKYNAAHTVQFNLRLNKKTDSDVIEILTTQENKRQYLIDAIREKAQKE